MRRRFPLRSTAWAAEGRRLTTRFEDACAIDQHGTNVTILFDLRSKVAAQ